MAIVKFCCVFRIVTTGTLMVCQFLKADKPEVGKSSILKSGCYPVSVCELCAKIGETAQLRKTAILTYGRLAAFVTNKVTGPALPLGGEFRPCAGCGSFHRRANIWEPSLVPSVPITWCGETMTGKTLYLCARPVCTAYDSMRRGFRQIGFFDTIFVKLSALNTPV